MPDHWYSPADLPPGRLGARVHDGRRTFPAARLIHPKRKTLMWCEPPALGTPMRWRPDLEVVAWQPLDAAKWTWPPGRPVPAPIPTPESVSRETPASSQKWWLTAEAVLYQKPGSVDRRMAEGRMLRGLVTDGVRHLARPRLARSRLPEPPLIEMVGDSDEDWTWLPPLEPTQADHGDVDTVMSWFAALNPPHMRPRDWSSRRGLARYTPLQVVLLFVAADPKPNWTLIGKSEHVCRSGKDCRKLYEQAVDCLARLANGQSVAGMLEV